MVVGAIALVGLSPAYAQESVAKFTAPFQFIVGETVLPAGSYSVTTVQHHPGVMWFQSEDGKSVASVFFNTTGPWSKNTNALFSFQRYGGHYFLAAVNIPGGNTRELALPKQRVEAMLAKLNGAKAGQPIM